MSNMAHFSAPVSSPNSAHTVAGNGTSPVIPKLDFSEDLSSASFSACAWHVEPSDTKLHHDFDESLAAWTAGFDKYVFIYAVGSGPMIQRSNVLSRPPTLMSTGSPSLPNKIHVFKILGTTEKTELLFSLVPEVPLSNKENVDLLPSYIRYLAPHTPVAERIDALILDEQGNEELLRNRQNQALWLKQVMASHWAPPLPQPFIGFDLEDGLFTASWQSDSECNTLMIDANEHTAWYDPWPATDSDNPIPGEIDLDTEDAWEHLRTALTTTQ